MQVDDILSFPFIDPPPKEALLRSLELLYSLDALDDDGKLNDVGKKMARFPLEPMDARCVIAAEIEGCAIETLAVLSMLSTDSVFQFSREADGQKNVARHKLKRKVSRPRKNNLIFSYTIISGGRSFDVAARVQRIFGLQSEAKSRLVQRAPD